MNALEQFYVDLDNSDWDVTNEDIIIKKLKEVQNKLYKADLKDQTRLALIEHQVFQFVKSPEKGLAPTFIGTRDTEDGEKTPSVWPDINWFINEDFDYVNDRFNNCKNIFAKTEYGLFLFYSKKIDHAIVLELLNTLFELLKLYIEKGKKDRTYLFNAKSVLSNTLFIAITRRKDSKIESVFKDVVQYAFDIYEKWDINDTYFEHILSIFSLTFLDYFKNINDIIDLKKVVAKNYQFAKSQPNSSLNIVSNTVHIADISIDLSNKLKIENKKWQYLKAAKYEKIAEIRKGDPADIHFILKAISIYKNLKDVENLDRVQSLYQELRTKHKMETHTQKNPQSETNRTIKLIKKDVKEKTENELVKILLQVPMLKKLDVIKKESEESFKEPLLKNHFGSQIIDKFGNTVARFSTLKHREEFELLKIYGYYLDIANQFMIHFFMEAYRANKISASGIINFLNNSWLGEEAIREVNNRNVKFNYIKSIEPGITIFFDEMKKWKEDSNYIPNFIASVDSLILKAEYLLREICTFLGIHTFKPNVRKPGIIMEKTLDDLLSDLKGKISEDDHFFIKFVLSDKVGYNLRHKIAHGLMDNIDYQLEHVLLAIIIILKLSNYQFDK